MTEPIIKPAKDGIYPKCVWCGGENYAMAVMDYSKGKTPCMSADSCGKYLPEETNPTEVTINGITYIPKE